MIVNRFVRDLVTEIGNRQADEAHKMANGQCSGMDDYCGRVGFVRGLNEAAAMAQQLLKRSAEDDDLEDV